MKISTSSSKRSSSSTTFFTLRTFVSFIILAWVLAFAYYMNSPTPNGIVNPWQYKCFNGAKRLVIDMASVISLFTSSHYIIPFRSLIENALPKCQREVPGSNIRSSVTTFGGVKVRLYEPIEKQPGLGPALVFIHGGAFVLGSADMFDMMTRRFAEELDSVVVSIDYRLAPEHPFPAAFEDCITASRWFMDHAEDFNVDRSRIGIAGDSAGGTLTASVSQILHDDGRYPDFAFQALIYPLTQFIDNHTPGSMLSKSLFGMDGAIVTWQEAGEFTCLYFLGRAEQRVVDALIDNTHTSVTFKRESPLAQYVNHTLLPLGMQDYGGYKAPNVDEQRGDDTVWEQLQELILDQRASPLLRPDMKGLPPTFLATCEFDPIRDHGVFYALRLREAGVPVRWEHYDGGFHGVLGPTWPLVFEVGEKIFQDLIVFFKEHLKITEK
ncbi:neutral cholesterol ester hydrolase 1-like [Asterias amurensis]|uniref:neutral cholesterol ester hydrolase 1-like n=1 Tax=Asterias amurensis TaxID=7602 RepID=UPI003AB7E7DE